MFRTRVLYLDQLCAGALFVVLATASAVAEPAPTETDKAMQREANFKAGFVHGCMKRGEERGLDERYRRAYCVCTMLQFRAAMSETEFRELLDRHRSGQQPSFELPQFGRGLAAGVECENVGRYDVGSSEQEKIELVPRRRFEQFSIRLPRGFISAPVPVGGLGRVQNFVRLHADLESAAVLSFGVVPATAFPGSEHAAGTDSYLRMTFEALKRQWQKSEWANGPVEDQAVGPLIFKGMGWNASEASVQQVGVVYVTVVRDQVIIVTIHDGKRHAVMTLPLMQSSLKTLIFHGADDDNADARQGHGE